MKSSPQRPAMFADARGVDVLYALLLAVAGWFFLADHARWAGWWVFLGQGPMGDAAFWWGGVLDAHSGDIATNTNLTFRMGFAVMGALVTALTGPDILAFHRVLVAAYLGGAVLMYFALRPVAGRFFAMGATALIVFNAFIAEWLANMTSDGLGLTLNLYALAFFLVGVRGRGRLNHLVLFAVFLALAGLTRPLMNLFLAPALGLLFFVHTTWRRRALLAAATLATYIVPVVAWMLVLHSQTGMWSVAGHSGSIFYASSDPKIQQWSWEMYPEIENAAMERFHTKAPTPEQIDSIFRERAIANYLANWKHHAARVLPTAWVCAKSAANVGFRDVSNKWEPARKVRLWLLLALCAAGLVMALWRGNGLGAAAIVVTGILLAMKLDEMQAVLLLGATVFFSLALLKRTWDLAYPILGLYLLVALASMYLVGGVWWVEPPGLWHINALGVRLSSQYITAADIVIALSLAAVSRWTVPAWVRSRRRYRILALRPARQWRAYSNAFRTRVRRLAVPRSVRRLLMPDRQLPDSCARVAGSVGAMVLVLVFLGAARLTIAVVSYERQVEASPWPPVTAAEAAVAEALRAHGFDGTVEAVTEWTPLNNWLHAEEVDPRHYLVLGAGLSPMIGNVAGQQRSLSRFFLQESVRPFTLGHRYVDLEVPQHLDLHQWGNRQGAWVFNRLPHGAPPSHLIFYNSFPVVRAFVPLNAEGTGYNVDRIVWFDDVADLSQLDALGLLQTDAASWAETEWPDFAGQRLDFPRVRTYTPEGSSLTLELDAAPAAGQGVFASGFEIVSEDRTPSPAVLEIQRLAPGSDTWETVEVIQPQPNEVADRLRQYHKVRASTAGGFAVDLAAPPTEAVRLRVTGLRPGDRVRFLETELRAPQLHLGAPKL